MKRLICTLLAACLLLSFLASCGQKLKEPVIFYYRKDAYEENMVSPIEGEEREVAGHRDNLKYLLSFYLMGPISKDLISPLPRGTLVYNIIQKDTELTIELSNTSALLTDSEFSLACACLSMTCMGLANVENVTIVSGSRSLTFASDNLLLSDTITSEENTK